MPAPTVSVVIPTYNSARYLEDAVDSVLAQSFKSLEVIVIDDGSNDDTGAVMGRYGASVRYISQHNQGVAAARNHGIEHSRGRYVAFLDADDIWLPHKIQRQLQALEERPECRLCYSEFAVASSDLAPLDVERLTPSGLALEDLLMRGNVIGSPSTVLSERSLLIEVGCFDIGLSQCADWDLWVRIAANTEILFLEECLVTYRKHSESMSNNIPLLERDSLRVLEKGFAMSGVPASLRSQIRKARARNYMVVAGSYLHAGSYRDFLRCAARAVSLDLRQLDYIAAYPSRAASRRLRHAAAQIKG
jgi:glycosyltransferase involved in cell wall biosynthesis